MTYCFSSPLVVHVHGSNCCLVVLSVYSIFQIQSIHTLIKFFLMLVHYQICLLNNIVLFEGYTGWNSSEWNGEQDQPGRSCWKVRDVMNLLDLEQRKHYYIDILFTCFALWKAVSSGPLVWCAFQTMPVADASATKRWIWTVWLVFTLFCVFLFSSP